MNTPKTCREAAPMLLSSTSPVVVHEGDPGLRSTTQRGCDNDEGKQLVPSRDLSGLWGTNRFWVVPPIIGGKPGEKRRETLWGDCRRVCLPRRGVSRRGKIRFGDGFATDRSSPGRPKRERRVNGMRMGLGDRPATSQQCIRMPRKPVDR